MDISEEIARRFDLGFSDHYLEKVETPEFPDFRVGILLGSSGSGKTTILQSMGDISLDQYTNKAICEHFADAEEAIHYLKFKLSKKKHNKQNFLKSLKSILI